MNINEITSNFRPKFFEGQAKNWVQGFPAYAEYKEDGEYVLIFITPKRTLIANRHKSTYHPTKYIQEYLPKTKCILEAEYISINGSLYSYLSERGEDSDKLALRIFGILHYEGSDVSDLPYEERWKTLEKLIPDNNQYVKLVKHQKVETPEDIDNFFNQAISDGKEGIVVKSFGKRSTCMKLKKTSTKDYAILGFEKSQSWNKNHTPESFILGTLENDEWKQIGKASSGLTKDEKAQLGVILLKNMIAEDSKQILSKPTEVLEIKYQEQTDSGLRIPRIIRWRKDKTPKMIDGI